MPNKHPAPHAHNDEHKSERVMTARIGIIGMGHVGKSMFDLFAQHAQIVTFDANGTAAYPEDELAACDVGVVCVDTPTAEGGACDIRMSSASRMGPGSRHDLGTTGSVT
jgi:UDP-N-acetyl-D-mannosaminuronate dehydrogenase